MCRNCRIKKITLPSKQSLILLSRHKIGTSSIPPSPQKVNLLQNGMIALLPHFYYRCSPGAMRLLPTLLWVWNHISVASGTSCEVMWVLHPKLLIPQSSCYQECSEPPKPPLLLYKCKFPGHRHKLRGCTWANLELQYPVLYILKRWKSKSFVKVIILRKYSAVGIWISHCYGNLYTLFS